MNAPLAPPQDARWLGPRLDSDLASSCRVAVLFMLFSSVVWLVISSLLALTTSLKLHAPDLFADSASLTYGRLQPAHLTGFIHGFALQAGWAIALWMLVRLGRTRLRLPGLVVTGALVWNLALAYGLPGILDGHRTGFDGFDLPGPALVLLFGGYLMIGVPALLTFRDRRNQELSVSQWFILAALFWFPWIHTTAYVLLVLDPVRGVVQAIVHWWYLSNLSWIALGFPGLAVLFHAIPQLLGRPLHSRPQALAAFWMLALFVTWTGIPDTAPLPAWIPAVSMVFAVLTIVPLLAIALNWHATLAGSYGEIGRRWPLWLVVFSAAAFLCSGLLMIAGSLPAVSQITQFSIFTPGRQWLFFHGFIAMAIFGALYMGMPDLLDGGLPSGRLVRMHVWCVSAGIILYAFPLLLGGVIQGLAMQDPAIPFAAALRPGLTALRIAFLGDLLLFCGHAALLVNLCLAFGSLCRRCCNRILAEATRPQPAGMIR